MGSAQYLSADEHTSPAAALDLERALAQLGDTARTVVWLHDVEGYTHEEIPAQLVRTASFSKSQLSRAHARLREVLRALAKGVPSPGMAQGFRNSNAGTAREKAGREDLQKQLATATGFKFLAEDDVKSRGIERRGETISRIAFYLMPGERDVRFRFFLNDMGEVADFSSELVDAI